MQYSQWRTRFDEAKELFPESRRSPLKERMITEAERLMSMNLAREDVHQELERLSQEYLWLYADQPYYNLHPGVVPYLCRCNLDNIPAELVEMPGNCDTVHIRFAEPHADLVVEGSEYVRSILLAKPVLSRLSKTDGFTRLLGEGERATVLDKPSHELYLRIDLGERGEFRGVSTMKDWAITVHLESGRTLGEEFARYEDIAPDRIAPGTRRREVVKNCLRLIATVGFLANSPDETLIQHDVLGKDRAKFENADEAQKQKIIARARRRGKRGWNIGTNEFFVGQLPKLSSGKSSGEGTEHTHAHIRTGHLHAVRFGEAKKYVKIKWFRPTVVRPDLPFQ